jgi:hypothetical protein
VASLYPFKEREPACDGAVAEMKRPDPEARGIQDVALQYAEAVTQEDVEIEVAYPFDVSGGEAVDMAIAVRANGDVRGSCQPCFEDGCRHVLFLRRRVSPGPA